MVLVSTFAMGRDPAIWGSDAASFNPEHFDHLRNQRQSTQDYSMEAREAYGASASSTAAADEKKTPSADQKKSTSGSTSMTSAQRESAYWLPFGAGELDPRL